MLRFVHKTALAAAAVLLAALLAAPGAVAQVPPSAAASQAAWDHVTTNALRAPTPARPLVAPERFAAFTLDQPALSRVLSTAPAERRRTAAPAAGAGLTIAIPAPDGGFERFAIVDSPVMAPGLAAAHPEIKTYAGRGIDDPTATVRLDLSPLGFHASVRSAGGQWFVDPRFRGSDEHVAYARDALAEDPYAGFEETVPDRAGAPAPAARDDRAGEGNGGLVTLRVFRLALISDPTYGANTPGTTTAAKAALLNRVNQLYEQDFAFRLELAAGNDALNLDTAAQATGAGGPCGAAACFTAAQLAGCTAATLDRANVVAGRVLGAGSYDVAHLILGVNGGGIAGLRVVGTSSKGRGCTGLPNPVGDFFAVDYVAHELGHQFGGDHTFNGTTNGASNCGPANRAASQAPRVEPGSGSSVMAYAGICATDDLQDHSDPYFSQASITQITSYVTGAEATQAPVQQAGLNDFAAGSSSFSITYGGGTSAPISTLSASTIKAAIEGISGWPVGATVSVSGVSTAGFTVTFGGTLAAGTPAALGFANVSGFAGGVFGVTAVAGTTHHGGTPDASVVNHAPSVTLAGAASYAIPARTPFLLDAAGSDAEGEAITYMWEQDDPGGGTAIPLTTNAKANGPLFRMFGTAARYADPYNDPYQYESPGENAAAGQTWRSFPDPAQVAAGNTNAATGACPTASTNPVADSVVDCYSEFLPTADWVGVAFDRTLHFRVTARDDHPGAGGVGTADVALTVAPGAGPFRVTSQAAAASVAAGTALPVAWAVAGTNASPVNTTNVKISLSLDGGLTFPHVLAASTPNDGAEAVTLPQVATTQARIKVEAINNVFYDVSRGNLTIGPTAPVAIQAPASASLGSAVVGETGPATVVTFTNNGTGPATLGAAALGGTDAAAIAKAGDTCASGTLAAGASCAITLRLTPAHDGAQAATLSLPSDDAGSPATVALSGTGVAIATAPPPADAGARTPATTTTAPTTTPVPAPGTTTPTTPTATATRLVATVLGVPAPYAVGTAGTLKLFTPSKATTLGKPKATKLIAAAACASGQCRGTATAKLTLTSRRGTTVKATTITLAKALALADGQARGLTLKLTAQQRKAIKAARKARLVLTVTNGTAKVTRAFTLTVG